MPAQLHNPLQVRHHCKNEIAIPDKKILLCGRGFPETDFLFQIHLIIGKPLEQKKAVMGLRQQSSCKIQRLLPVLFAGKLKNTPLFDKTVNRRSRTDIRNKKKIAGLEIKIIRPVAAQQDIVNIQGRYGLPVPDQFDITEGPVLGRAACFYQRGDHC